MSRAETVRASPACWTSQRRCYRHLTGWLLWLRIAVTGHRSELGANVPGFGGAESGVQGQGRTPVIPRLAIIARVLARPARRPRSRRTDGSGYAGVSLLGPCTGT